ncbi:MAG TPA: CCA tRNA nucleotidyltransferase [Aeromicrobium sp.]|nr:CCA tRNA nucleotidyltransferase [Aeromicrobium sp.]
MLVGRRERGRGSVECVLVPVESQRSLSVEQRARIDRALDTASFLADLGRAFAADGHELAVVGGPVRDAVLGRPVTDWDFATSATPDQIERIVEPWAEATWDMGREYGTIGLRHAGHDLEITTYRSDSYDPSSRKPDVTFGDSLDGDLSRRDFAVNAMAIRLPSREFVDLFGGVDDIEHRRLRTPVTAEQSFSDDPLRMMRAARFAAQLDFTVADDVLRAMTAMAERITIVAAERIRVELDKTLLADHPVAGLRLLVDTGLAAHVLPELPALMLERDEHHRHKDVYEHSLTVLEQAIALEHRLPDGGPDLVNRLAALLHDIGKPKTRRFGEGGVVTFHHHDVVGAKLARKRLTALRYSNDVIDQVSRLIELHLRFHGYGSGEWTDSAVRRYVRDAGDQLQRLHILTRADCTTRNARKAARLQRTYDGLEERIEALAAREELDAIRPDLDGTQIMQILGIGPGRDVGEAYRFLLDLRMDRGPLSVEHATEALLAWWAARSG